MLLMVLLITTRRLQLLVPPAMADSLLLMVEESRVITPMLLLCTPQTVIRERFPSKVTATIVALAQLLMPAPEPATLPLIRMFET